MEIRGADDVGRLVKNIREHADSKALRRELSRGLAIVARDITPPMLDAIPDALPERGGLAAHVQGKVKGRATAKAGKYAGVSLRFTGRGVDVRTLTGKRLRHPVFGNRGVWVEQTKGVDPEAFPRAFEQQKDEATRRVLEVIEDVARKVCE